MIGKINKILQPSPGIAPRPTPYKGVVLLLNYEGHYVNVIALEPPPGIAPRSSPYERDVLLLNYRGVVMRPTGFAPARDMLPTRPKRVTLNYSVTDAVTNGNSVQCVRQDLHLRGHEVH